MNEAGVFVRELPECFDAAALFNDAQDGSAFLIQSGGKHCNEDILQEGVGKRVVDEIISGKVIVKQQFLRKNYWYR